MKRLSVMVLSAVLVLLSAATAFAAKEREEIRQNYPITAGGTILLENVNGDVKIKAWDEQRVELLAVKTGSSKENLDLVKVEIKNTPDRIEINTVYPKGKHNVNVSVAYELKVPKNVNLNKIDTVNGSIDIEGVEGQIEAESVNGSINIEGGNTVSAETVNGSIRANLLRMPEKDSVKFETVNGSLTIFLPENINAEVEAETVNGKINSDLPITVQGSFGSKHMRGKLGNGGGRLKLETTNGSINLTRQKAS